MAQQKQQEKKMNWFARFKSDNRKIKWADSNSTLKAFGVTILVVTFLAVILWVFTLMVTAIIGAMGI